MHCNCRLLRNTCGPATSLNEICPGVCTGIMIPEFGVCLQNSMSEVLMLEHYKVVFKAAPSLHSQAFVSCVQRTSCSFPPLAMLILWLVSCEVSPYQISQLSYILLFPRLSLAEDQSPVPQQKNLATPLLLYDDTSAASSSI